MEEKTWEPTNLDLILSTGFSLGLPALFSILYDALGALIPMIIYYVIAWGVMKWRRGHTGYLNKPKKKLPVSFVINLVIIVFTVILGSFAPIKTIGSNVTGVVLTTIFWPLANASSEQLLWIYIFEAWDLRFPWKDAKNAPQNGKASNQRKNWIFRAIGLILNTVFVGTVHTMFWTKFLHVVDSEGMIGIIFLITTSISGYIHLWAWRESNNMVFTFIPHYILNLVPFFWIGFSMVPYLVMP